MRCLTLGEKLRERGGEVTFISRMLPGYPVDAIHERGFAVRLLNLSGISAQPSINELDPLDALWKEDAEAVVAELASFHEKVDWLIVDHYGLDARWEGLVHLIVNHLMVIDDLANRKHQCDLLLDPTFGEDRRRYADCLNQQCEGLFGSTYALLRPEFQEFRKDDECFPNSDSYAVHMFFGAGDQGALTLKFAEILLSHFPGIKLNAVVKSVSEQYRTAFARLRDGYPERFKLIENPDSMAKTMYECDVAIGAPGTTTWERACAGIPSAYLATAENQVGILRGLESKGLCVFLGRATEISDTAFVDGIRMFFGERKRLLSMRMKGIHTIDGNGASRVAEKILSLC